MGAAAASYAAGATLPQDHIAARDVAIVVPVGGDARWWGRSSRSLARLDPAPGQIVAVIDGHNDELAARAAAIGATVVRLAERVGPAKARNRGAHTATREILFFVDADVEVPVDLVSRVAALFAEHPDMAAVIGSYDDAPSHPGVVSQYRNLLHHFVHQHGREEASTFWAGCGAVRRAAFAEVGGFDEGYAEPSIEDIALGARLVRAGHGIRLVASLQVKHLKRWRVSDMLATDLWRRAVPWTVLMLRDGQIVNDLNVKVRDRSSVVAAFSLPAALAGAWRWPALAVAAAVALILLVALNARLFGFFVRKRGAWFAVRAVPLYWVYLVICGLGFALGMLRHLLGRSR
jgi:GT2 family glycosyltransferase